MQNTVNQDKPDFDFPSAKEVELLEQLRAQDQQSIASSTPVGLSLAEMIKVDVNANTQNAHE